MFEECRHIMPNGSKCQGIALHGKAFCRFHVRVREVMSKAKQQAKDEPFELPVLEDRHAIQLALAQVLNALGSSRLDPKRAGLYLYGLQLATQTVDRNSSALSLTNVGCTNQTDDGDELGPRCGTERAPWSCHDCLKRNNCANYRLYEQEREAEEQDEDSDEEDEVREPWGEIQPPEPKYEYASTTEDSEEEDTEEEASENEGVEGEDASTEDDDEETSEQAERTTQRAPSIPDPRLRGPGESEQLEASS